eukprot:1256156-Rhodomonas_salina.1
MPYYVVVPASALQTRPQSAGQFTPRSPRVPRPSVTRLDLEKVVNAQPSPRIVSAKQHVAAQKALTERNENPRLDQVIAPEITATSVLSVQFVQSA